MIARWWGWRVSAGIAAISLALLSIWTSARATAGGSMTWFPRGNHVIEPPAVARADVHILNKASDIAAIPAETRQPHHRAIIDAALDHGVDLDGRKPHTPRRLDPGDRKSVV